MLIRPIPKIMMPNKVKYSAFGADSRYGNTYDDVNAITLWFVRLVPKSQLKWAATNESLDFNSILFIDPITSKWGNDVQVLGDLDVYTPTFQPKEKDKITFNGVDFVIVNANPLYVDNGKLHHWECTLNRM